MTDRFETIGDQKRPLCNLPNDCLPRCTCPPTGSLWKPALDCCSLLCKEMSAERKRMQQNYAFCNSHSNKGNFAPPNGMCRTNNSYMPSMQMAPPMQGQQNLMCFVKSLLGAFVTSTILLVQFWILATYSLIGGLKWLYCSDRKTKIAVGIVLIILVGLIIFDRRGCACSSKGASERSANSTELIENAGTPPIESNCATCTVCAPPCPICAGKQPKL